MFFSVKNWPGKRNFDIFRPRIFSKNGSKIFHAFFNIFIFSDRYPTLKFGISLSVFRKTWVKTIKIFLFGPVFNAQKDGQKIFPKFEFFEFWRNQVWDQPIWKLTKRHLQQLIKKLQLPFKPKDAIEIMAEYDSGIPENIEREISFIQASFILDGEKIALSRYVKRHKFLWFWTI